MKLTETYPYITHYKKPQWYPFSLKKVIPDFYIPYYDLIMKYYEDLSNKILNYRNVNLENIYWYLIMGRYLKVDLTKLRLRNEILKYIEQCEVETEDQLGFKFSPFSKQKVPDIWSTAFALVSLKLLKQFNSYLKSHRDVDVKQKIRNFIFTCQTKKGFQHCTRRCEICRKTSEYKTIFSVLESLLVLDDSMGAYTKNVLPLISKNPSGNSPKNLFRLIDLKYFSSFEDVSSQELDYFLPFQRKDGGFNFKNSASGSINETFWIAMVFENYRYLAEYPRGNLYAFIVQKLKMIDLEKDPKDPLKLMEYAKLIVLLSYVWHNLIDELEEILFTGLNKSLVMDINTLTYKGGVRNAEYEVIAFINLKYNLALNIVDNETRFSQFASRLDVLERQFANVLFIASKQYVRIDLSEIVYKFNKGKSKSLRIAPDFLIKLVERMKEEHFFTGKINEKKKVFKRYYYFDREQFIPKIITCNRTVNVEDIATEKKRLNDVREDIYNMVREMRESSQNIMREVESLIFAEEIEYAEKRLKSNIKKALFDAEFFNKTVTKSIEDFEYIKGKEALSDILKDWDNVYGNLRSDFNNVTAIMSEKIRESEKLQKQKDLLKELETLIAHNIADLGISFDMFQDAIRKKLEKTYTRDNVLKVELELESLVDKIKEYDHQIVEASQQILADDNNVRKKRKKIIESWVSNKQEFESVYSYYLEGFKTWHKELEFIDDFYQNYKKRVEDLKAQINTMVLDRNYDSAFNILDKDFDLSIQSMGHEVDKFEKNMNKLLKKQKKLYLLFINLEDEIESKKSDLEILINEIRENLKKQVVVDKKRLIKEDFIILVNNKIDFLNESVDALEKQIDEMLNEGKLSGSGSNEYIEQQFAYLDAIHTKSNHEVETQLKLCQRNIPNFRLQAEIFIKKWDKFTTSFEPKIKNMKNSLLDDIVKKSLSKFTFDTHTNQIDLSKVADTLQMDRKVVRERVVNMLNISKLSGDLIEGTYFLIIHDEEWHKNKRLGLFIDGELNELSSITKRINQLYETSVENATFGNTLGEFEELTKKFYSKKENADIIIMQKINYLKPNKNNSLFIENMQRFKDEVHKKTELVESINLKAKKSVDFADYATKQLQSIKDVIELSIHKLVVAADDRHGIVYKKNHQWLNQELQKIDFEINNLNKEFKSKMDRIWSGIHSADQIKGELLQNFETNLNEILNDFNELRDELQQKILNFEYVRVQHELEKILSNKQEILNNYLGNIKHDVENRIEIKDFKGAMQKLHQKISTIDEQVRKAEKELRQKNKKITSKSKVFPVKNKYLLDRWDLFKDEYDNVVQEKQLSLELEIIEQYIKLVIKIFKGEYISFSYLAREFGLKEDVVRERIIRLIGDQSLTGRIYPDLDIYYENEEAINKLDQDAVNLMKASKAERFLMKQKLIRTFIDLLPIISGSLAIILYLVRLINELPIPWYLILLVIILVIGVVMGRVVRSFQKKQNFQGKNK